MWNSWVYSIHRFQQLAVIGYKIDVKFIFCGIFLVVQFMWCAHVSQCHLLVWKLVQNMQYDMQNRGSGGTYGGTTGTGGTYIIHLEQVAWDKLCTVYTSTINTILLFKTKKLKLQRRVKGTVPIYFLIIYRAMLSHHPSPSFFTNWQSVSRLDWWMFQAKF